MGQGGNRRNSIAGPMRLVLRERSNSIRADEAITNSSSSVGVARDVIYYRSSKARGDKKVLTSGAAMLEGTEKLLRTRTVPTGPVLNGSGWPLRTEAVVLEGSGMMLIGLNESLQL